MGNTTISYALPPMLAQNFPEIEYYARTENYSRYSNCIVPNQDANQSNQISFNESDFYLADNNLFKIIHSSRIKEIGIRKVPGAKRIEIIH